jgi:2,4-dienoyl-CoA reductase-like NADH-dependent reductase (Old Yellow Enzyme family)
LHFLFHLLKQTQKKKTTMSAPPVPNLAANALKPAGVPVNPGDVERVKLFQPYHSKSVTIHNRIGVSPMCMYSAVDGHLNSFHDLHYGSLALKGAGLVFIEATAVKPEGRITSQDSGLWDDSHIVDLKRVVDIIKSQGSTAGMQIGHAGRKSSMSPPFKGDYLETEAEGGWPQNVFGPSEIAYADHYAQPHAMTVQQIKETVQAFVDAAVRADKAGIAVLEIHAAHG